MAGLYKQTGSGVLAGLLATPGARRDVARMREAADAACERFALGCGARSSGRQAARRPAAAGGAGARGGVAAAPAVPGRALLGFEQRGGRPAHGLAARAQRGRAPACCWSRTTWIWSRWRPASTCCASARSSPAARCDADPVRRARARSLPRGVSGAARREHRSGIRRAAGAARGLARRRAQRDRSPSSAPTAPASPPWCAPSAACCRRRPVASLHDGVPISDVPAHERTRHGIAVVLENRHLFGELTVRNNLELAAAHGKRRLPAARGIRQRFDLDEVLDLFPFMRGRLDAPVALLSRRRAADGGDRTRPAAASRAADHGRAVHRARRPRWCATSSASWRACARAA